MEIVHGIGRLKRRYKNPVMAIGVFDGLHHGHQRIIRDTVKGARQINGTAIVVTFSPHPVQVLKPKAHLPLIVSLSYRLRLIRQLGVDVCIVIPFTKRFSHLAPEKFIQRYLVGPVKPKVIIVGDDFRFGQNRTGTLDYFKEAGQRHGFDVSTVGVMRGGKKTVSSTRIRKFIAQGKLSRASRLLDRPVSLLGRVVRGDARGRKLGYPTANIDPSGVVIPPPGVFVAHIRIAEKLYRGMVNIGRRPSFKRTSKVNIEVHIFDFNKNLYGKEIIIEFVKKIRDEKLFSSPSALIKQIRVDERKARKWFSCCK